MAFPEGWGYKWPIAISADSVISSPVADWPCLITDVHIPAGAWAQMQATGADLRFSLDEAGATELYYDAPRLSVAGESAHLYVRVPSLASGADTTIYGWVGNAEATAPSAAWMQSTYPADWAGFWPMEEGSGTTVGDRTVSANHGTLPAEAEFRYPTEYDATPWQMLDDWYITQPFTTSAPLSAAFTLLLRVQTPTSYRGRQYLLNRRYRGTGSTIDYWYGGEAAGKAQYYNAANVYVTSTGAVPLNSQVTIGVSCDETNIAHWLNGSANGGGTGAARIGTPLLIGARESQFGIYWPEKAIGHGLLVARALSADEIAIHHLMLSSPATFATAGDLVAVGGKRIRYPWHTPGFNAGLTRL